MIQASTLQFLKLLKKNNDRSWVEAHRPAYEDAKKDFLELTRQLIVGTSGFDIEIAKANLEEKRSVSRLNRDVRFSKDKSPYKTNFFAMLSKGGRKSPYAGYYFQLEPGKSFAGGGVYMPMPPELGKFRQEIDYNYKSWMGIIKNKSFQKTFPMGLSDSDALKRMPKGFNENNPAMEFLKMKSFYTYATIPDEALLSRKGIKTILHHFEMVKPLLTFLNGALD
jgi:uncharacterized protein (TIGR02453 family)